MIGVIDVLLLAVFGIVIWCVASEGAWGAVVMAFVAVFSALLAVNFFEPLATFLEESVSDSSLLSPWWDVVSLVGLFVLFAFLLRTACERLLPQFIPVHPIAHEIGRWVGGALAGYVTMAFLLMALHTAPLPRDFAGFTPERNNFFGLLAPDRQMLGFMQYATEKPFRRSNANRVFDGPQFPVGEQPNKIWPSFPIRYASRRSGSSGGSSVTRPAEVSNKFQHMKPSAKTSKPGQGTRSGPDF